jgi:catalase
MGAVSAAPPEAARAVDALRAVFGHHPGHRAAHAKGVVCRGRFTATPAAAALSRAEHLQGAPVEAIVRFSNMSGRPGRPDHERDVRGMAVKFVLPSGAATDIVAANLPCFLARTPEDFVAFTRATVPDPGTGRARPRRILAHVVRHPESIRPLASLALRHAPASYATCRYNALHALGWVNADGRVRHLRCGWIPLAGERGIATRRARALGPDRLRDELAARLAGGPVEFDLELQLAAPGDPLDDSTARWPRSRERLTAGRLAVEALADDRDPDGGPLVFDPLRLVDGIEPSPDPLLAFRSASYALSAARRGSV